MNQYTTPTSTANAPAPRRNRLSVLTRASCPRLHGGMVPVPPVEHRPFRADRGEPVEVVLQRRRRGDPLQRVAPPRGGSRWQLPPERRLQAVPEQGHPGGP